MNNNKKVIIPNKRGVVQEIILSIFGPKSPSYIISNCGLFGSCICFIRASKKTII